MPRRHKIVPLAQALMFSMMSSEGSYSVPLLEVVQELEEAHGTMIVVRGAGGRFEITL